MKSLILVAALAFVAVQVIRAAPAPEDEKKEVKEAAVAAAPSAAVEVKPLKAEVKPEAAGVTHLEESSAPAQKDGAAQPAEPEKAQ